MSEIYIISDTHFGHANFLTFKCADGSPVRNFSCVEEMDEHMVERWNSVVTNNDIVYHLGDVYMGDGYKHLSRLNGRKYLILGNHDNAKAPYIVNNFEEILMYRVFSKYGILLTHVPVHISVFEHRKLKNVHGHTHQNILQDSNYINACVEHHEYTPKHISTMVPYEQSSA